MLHGFHETAERRSAPTGPFGPAPWGTERETEESLGNARIIKESFASESHTTFKGSTIILSVFVIFVVYGLFYIMNAPWFWSLLLALFAGWLFWYLCQKCDPYEEGQKD